MVSITDIRVVQYQKWVESEDGTKKLEPVSHKIQVRIADSISWTDVKVEFVTLDEENDG